MLAYQVAKIAPLNDRTEGFRFRHAIKVNNTELLVLTGTYRKRKPKNKRYGIKLFQPCTHQIHFGRRSFYIEHKRNRKTKRKFGHFAG